MKSQSIRATVIVLFGLFFGGICSFSAAGKAWAATPVTQQDVTYPNYRFKNGETLKSLRIPSPQVLSSSFDVQHIRIVSDQSFEDVRKNLETDLPKLDVSIFGALSKGDHDRAADYEKNGPALSIFLVREHGLLLQIFGKPGKSVQYEIGNPMTAIKMTHSQLAAALYVPLRVVLYADENGKGVFEYEKPSSLLSKYDDARVLEVAYGLDALIEKALCNAATEKQSKSAITGTEK